MLTFALAKGGLLKDSIKLRPQASMDGFAQSLAENSGFMRNSYEQWKS
jgi:hypothetical protein